MTEERLKELERLAMKCPELMDYRPYTYQANEAENAFYQKANPAAVLELIAEISILHAALDKASHHTELEAHIWIESARSEIRRLRKELGQ